MIAAGARGASANTLTVSDVSLAERDTGTRDFTFSVTLDRSTCTNTVTVQYTTVNDVAIAPGDYTARSGTLTFPPPQVGCVDQFQSISVVVQCDVSPEPHETFKVVLSNPVNATLADAVGIGTIFNDDTYLAVHDTSAVEGSGPSTMRFRVTLSHPSVLTVSVAYATADVSATHPEDFGETRGTATFSQGVTVGYLDVPLVGDANPEAEENFIIQLSNSVNGFVIDNTGIGRIVDDDTPVAVEDPAAPRFALTSVAPNPMRDQMTVAFTLARESRVELAVYALDGRRVRTLASGSRNAGSHVAAWNGRDDRGRGLPSGVYFCRLAAGGERAVRRLVKLD